MGSGRGVLCRSVLALGLVVASVTVWSGAARAAAGDADVGLPVPSTTTYVARDGIVDVGGLFGNVGPATATDVVVTVEVPAGFTVLSATISGGACVVSAGTVTCTVASLPARLGSFSDYRVQVRAPSMVQSSAFPASVTADQPDPEPANNARTTEVRVGGAGVRIAAPLNGMATGSAPEMTFSADVRNDGPETADDVSVALALPPGFSFATTTAGSCDQSGATITCLLGSIGPGAGVALSVGVTTLDPPAADFTVTFTGSTSTFEWKTDDNARSTTVAVSTVASIGDASLYEGDGGADRQLKFPVTFSAPSTGSVRFEYRVVPGSASGGVGGDIDDRKGKVGRVYVASVSPKNMTKVISVKVRADLADELDEGFTVVLSNPGGGLGLRDVVGVGTVLDDDPGVGQRIGIGNVSVHEGDQGTVKASVVVTLAQPASEAVTFTLTAGGTAVAGVDYKALSKTGSKSFTIKPGKIVKVVTVLLYTEQLSPGDRTIVLTIGGVTGATVQGAGVGTLTILDAD